ncbi:MAG TPA: cupin domain-containing protein [Bryobacteraceae bacterium]
MADKIAFLLQPGETRGSGLRDIFGGIISAPLAGSDTDGGYAIMDGITPPGGGPPLHRHSREEESYIVLEGEFDFEVDGKILRAGPGCSVFAPRGTAHQFQNIGSTPGPMLSVVQPAGLEVFFDEVAAATAATGRADPSAMIPIFTKYGPEVLGPPMAVRRGQAKSAS